MGLQQRCYSEDPGSTTTKHLCRGVNICTIMRGVSVLKNSKTLP